MEKDDQQWKEQFESERVRLMAALGQITEERSTGIRKSLATFGAGTPRLASLGTDRHGT